MATDLVRPPNLLGLYTKAALGSMPGRRRPDPAAGLPDLAVRLDRYETDDDHVSRYRTVCGFAPGGHLPVTYPHVVAFPLHLALLTDDRFPFPAMGAVHIVNTIRQHRPILTGEAFSVDVALTDLAPHPRGRQAALTTVCRIDGTVVWDSETVVLHREESPVERPTPAAEDRDDPPTGPQVWQLPSGLGRQYAAVSGDRNPIHLFDLTALPLGFRHHIAHGMWSKARCLAELEHRLPDAFSTTVAFKKPVNLPGKVRFGARQDGDRWRFALTSPTSGVAHLLGRADPL